MTTEYQTQLSDFVDSSGLLFDLSQNQVFPLITSVTVFTEFLLSCTGAPYTVFTFCGAVYGNGPIRNV